ncbi:MAG: PIN domain-containing protein [Candidatus Aenigmatarchaeota archaeon]
MRFVLDASAIIYLQDFRKMEEIFIPPLVLEEIKDKISKMKLEAMNAKIFEPRKKFVEEVKKVAKETGDFEKLSEADFQVLALAKELKAKIVSDDYSIQNVAAKMGLEFVPIMQKGIKKIFKWKKYCPYCKKFFGVEEKTCYFCGATLKRIPAKLKERKKEKD